MWRQGLHWRAEEAPVYRGPAEVVGPAMLSFAGKRIVLYGVAKGVGVWRGPFIAPADYREMLTGHRQER